MQKQSLMGPKTAPERGALWDHYQEVRGDSERLCAPLQTEDNGRHARRLRRAGATIAAACSRWAMRGAG